MSVSVSLLSDGMSVSLLFTCVSVWLLDEDLSASLLADGNSETASSSAVSFDITSTIGSKVGYCLN